MLNLKVLRASLNECQYTGEDRTDLKFMDDVKDPKYYLHRAMEAIGQCEKGIDVQENSKLAIRLLNLYRVKSNEPLQSEGQPSDGTGSKDTK